MEATLDTPVQPAADVRPPRDGGVSTHQQCLRIALGADPYALRVDCVREILEVVQMTPLPLMPDFMRGVMNLRGAVIPVIDLGARLGLATTTLGKRTCVVIVDVPRADAENTQTVGVLVDAVFEVFDVNADNTEPVPRLGMKILAAHVRSMLRVRGLPTPEIHLETVLDQDELARLIGAHAATH